MTFLAWALLTLGICLLFAVWQWGVTNVGSDLLLAQDMANGTFASTILHCSNATVTFSRNTTLAQLTECTFPGYFPAAQAAPSPYIASDGNVHLTWPGVLFKATNGQQQTLSFSAVGPITMSGTLTVTVTAAGMTGSPRAVTVNVLTTDSNTALAEKIAAAINADADAGGATGFTVQYPPIGNLVVAQKKVAAANDATMNIAVADGTATGFVPVVTATQVLPGIAPGGSISDQITGWFQTDTTGTILLNCGGYLAAVPIVQAGAGQEVIADYPYGS